MATDCHPTVPTRDTSPSPPAWRASGLRLLYRRFWHEVAAKGWADTDLVVLDQTFGAPRE